MGKKNSGNSPQPCPISFALGIFGDRWTLLVLRDVLLTTHSRYKEILAANPGMATNVLSDRLKRLEDHGLIVKERDVTDGRQFIYKPTKSGVSVIPILVEMLIWGADKGGIRIPDIFVRGYRDNRDEFLGKLMKDAERDAGC